MLQWSKSRKATEVRLYSFSYRRELERQMRWRERAKIGEEENFENKSKGAIILELLLLLF
jgi:hypothetical protein